MQENPEINSLILSKRGTAALPSQRTEFLSGLRAELPILVGVVPFGMIYGVLALGAGMPAAAAMATSSVVFAGSAQFIMAQMIGEGAPGLVLVLTVFVVNLRHALYSASIAPYLKELRPAWKWLLSYLLTDEAYAVTIVHYTETDKDYLPSGRLEGSERDNRHWFLWGSGLALWTCWQLSTAAGVFLGAVVPESWSLDFTLALTFIALVTPLLKDRASQAAALSAGITAVLAFSMPYKLGLVSAAIIGILVGMLVESRR